MTTDVQTSRAAQLAAQLEQKIETYHRMKRALGKVYAEIRALEVELDREDYDGFGGSQTYGVKGGTLRMTEVKKGKSRAWVNTDVVDVEEGEMPEHLRPKRTRHAKIKDVDRLPTALAVELTGIAQGEDNPAEVVIEEKVKYPKVGDLREEYGERNRFVGTPLVARVAVITSPEGHELLLDPNEDI